MFFLLFIPAAERVSTRFTSNRTDYGKIMRKRQKGKSGSGSKPLSSLQRFKLQAYSFLRSYYTPRTDSDTLGNVSNLCTCFIICPQIFILYYKMFGCKCSHSGH